MTRPDDPFWIDRSDRVRLAVTGPDAAKMLHNLTTNDIKKLAVGRGCEAFVTSPQGKTLGFVGLLAEEGGFLLRADPGGMTLAGPHLSKYAVLDDAEIIDLGADSFELHLCGPGFEEALTKVVTALPEDDLDHAEVERESRIVRVIRESPFGRAGMTLIGSREDRPWADSFVETLDAWKLSEDDAEGLRIEAGTPRFGADVTADNLPQEIGRDARAISFVKGCYLGQETVARLDALGHVNKILRGLVVESGAGPRPGDPLIHDGKPAGFATSSGLSPRTGRSVALAMVRTRAAVPGTLVSWGGGEGRVTALPIP